MSQAKNVWPKSISVDKRIVRILSGSTYANFPSAIREIVTNSYDADAENVNIDIDIVNEIITIVDDGKGMSEEDFSFYLRIAGKTRKKEENTTKGKRKVIGQFGVGFLSALPFCEKYLIETTKKGKDEVLSATINCKDYFTEDHTKIDVDKIPITGNIKYDKSKTDDHYTRIRLVGFSPLTKSFFSSEYILKGKRNTVINYPPIDLFKWELCEYLPINYKAETEVEQILESLNIGFTHTPFHVYLNNERLFRNSYANTVLEVTSEVQQVGSIKFNYCILTNYEPIKPTEGRYWMLRNMNVGVGSRTTFGLGLEGKVYAKLAHLTGEVIIYEGLNDLINVSRDKFNFSPDYEALKSLLMEKLASWANYLDTVQSIEKVTEELDNKTKLSDISSLDTNRITKEIINLQNKGYSIKKADSKSDLGSKTVNINKEKKEIVISSDFTDYHKTITVLNKDFQLQLDSWDDDKYFPAIREEGGFIVVNEKYPLFQNKKDFNTLLKLHIILLHHLRANDIDLNSFKLIQENILKTFRQ